MPCSHSHLTTPCPARCPPPSRRFAGSMDPHRSPWFSTAQGTAVKRYSPEARYWLHHLSLRQEGSEALRELRDSRCESSSQGGSLLPSASGSSLESAESKTSTRRTG